MEKTYTYCNILPANYQTMYWYICDFPVKEDDIVVISIRAKGQENIKAGLVKTVRQCTESSAPYPPEYTKHIIRLFGKDEDAKLQKERNEILKAEAKNISKWESAEDLAMKLTLTKNYVGRDSKISSRKNMLQLIYKATEDEALQTTANKYFNNGFVVSKDGKTIRDYPTRVRYINETVVIPPGIVSANKQAFDTVSQIQTLVMPKEFHDVVRLRNIINRMIIEEGNESFSSDDFGLYSVKNGKKKLEEINSSGSILKVPESITELDEEMIPREVKVVCLPKSFRKLIKEKYVADAEISEDKPFVGYREWENGVLTDRGHYYYPRRIRYIVDEENEHLFTDEDSLYEVLPDGTYRLVTCMYFGRGRVLLLDNTSEIGEGAFFGHKKITSVKFPKTLRVIRKDAFAATGLEKITLPKSMKVIEKGAFRQCTKLKTASPLQSLDLIEKGVFAGCTKLDKTQAAWWRDNAVELVKKSK